MENSSVIVVDGLYKKFCMNLRKSLMYGTIDVTKKMLGFSLDKSQLRKSEFWALNNISFEVKRGETLGIMGANGSGKSTLLRVLTGIFQPDRGYIDVKGRIGALIAVGAGFHPHLTGRENIFLNATILGMKKDEIKKNFNRIIEFSEIGEFIDSPVSTYSSGMYVRLGFSIAVHCNPEIIIADEVLSVGDYLFQIKCFDKINELIKNGTSVLLVSHSDIAIKSVCSRVALLHRNHLIDIGATDDMITKYRSILLNEALEKQRKSDSLEGNAKIGDTTTGVVQIENLILETHDRQVVLKNKEPLSKIKYSKNQSIRLKMRLSVKEKLENCRISFYLRDVTKKFDVVYTLGACVSKINFSELSCLQPGVYDTEWNMDISGLTPSIYNLIFAIGDDQQHVKLHASIEYMDNYTFEIINSAELIESDAILNRPILIPKYDFDMKKTFN